MRVGENCRACDAFAPPADIFNEPGFDGECMVCKVRSTGARVTKLAKVGRITIRLVTCVDTCVRILSEHISEHVSEHKYINSKDVNIFD